MKKIIVSEDVLRECVSKHKFKKDICKELNISIETLNRLLKEYNIRFDVSSWCKGIKKPLTSYEYIDHQWLVDNYLNTTKSIAELSMEYGVSESLIESRVRRYGLSKKYKYYVDTNTLLNNTLPNTNYIAGLVATDGYVDSKHNSILIRLVGESEKELLESIKNYLCSNTPIVNIKDNVYELRISADGLREFMWENFNIPGKNKTFDVYVPNSFFDEDCAKSYVRGCIDGDGYIACPSSKRFKMSMLSASKKFIEGIVNILYTYTGEKLSVLTSSPRGTSTYYYISVGGKRALRILRWVYSGTCDLMLRRKYDNFMKVNDIV